jgi:hypothetical protein
MPSILDTIFNTKSAGYEFVDTKLYPLPIEEQGETIEHIFMDPNEFYSTFPWELPGKSRPCPRFLSKELVPRKAQ